MNKIRWLFWFIEMAAAAMAAGFLIHWRVFSGKVVPHVRVAGLEVSGVLEKDLALVLEKYFKENPNEIFLKYKGEELLKVADLRVTYDYVWTTNLAMTVGRSGNLLTQLRERVVYLFKPFNVEPAVSYDEDGLEGVITLADEKVRQEYVPARIDINEKGAGELMAGTDGVELDGEGLKNLMIEAVKKAGRQVVEVPVKKSPAKINDKRAVESLELAGKWLDKTLTLEYGYFRKKLSAKEVVSLLGVDDSPINEPVFEELFLLLEKKVNREPKDALFMFEGGRVVEFQADIKGVELNREEFKKELEKALMEIEEKVVLAVKLTEPKIKASEINDLGIKELLGRGESKFAHSIPSRVFNVALAAKRINYALVPPGEVFSFNQEVGEISAGTGYQSAYVIKDGRTALGDGGGTCQVSTTMFRAAMAAGLPIVERKAHSYRVSYYEQDSGPGVDATVYAPSADLKFLNDTPEYILIQTVVDSKNLAMYIDIYGTSDGRTSNIGKPRVWGQTPPPEPLYEDDPTLPMGQVKQIDWAAWGAKTAFDYKVEKDGKVIYEKTFYSNFRPWQAVYLRGTEV